MVKEIDIDGEILQDVLKNKIAYQTLQAIFMSFLGTLWAASSVQFIFETR